jgi:ubiquinone/menaquinone biosynthesis C-methylase UbiE
MPEDQSDRMHENRARALSFGAVATLYDSARPTYPAALIDDLMALEPHRVLDVGCGTGKAARLFVERGCDLLGIEPEIGRASCRERVSCCV